MYDKRHPIILLQKITRSAFNCFEGPKILRGLLIQTEILLKTKQMLKPFMVMSFVISKLGFILFGNNNLGNLFNTLYV